METFERGTFLNLAAVVEGSLIVIGLAVAWLTGTDARQTLVWDWWGALWGLLATVPMFAIFLLTYRFPVGPLKTIKAFVIESLGPSLARCRWYDLALLAIVAGFSEEFLFRGILQLWMETYLGWGIGLLASNLVFGLMHAVTMTYAVWATVTGCLLGLLLRVTGEPNLVAPMIAHGLYDFLAFLVIARAGARIARP